MASYRVDALEKFAVRTTYWVEAAGAEEAEGLCRSGAVPYESHTIEEGDEEWIETLSVESTGDCHAPTSSTN
jgi:hypothetical protein